MIKFVSALLDSTTWKRGAMLGGQGLAFFFGILTRRRPPWFRDRRLFPGQGYYSFRIIPTIEYTLIGPPPRSSNKRRVKKRGETGQFPRQWIVKVLQEPVTARTCRACPTPSQHFLHFKQPTFRQYNNTPLVNSRHTRSGIMVLGL